MAGSVIKGMATGVIVAGLGLVAASAVLPVPQMPGTAPATGVPLPVGSEFARPGAEALPAAPPPAPQPDEPETAPAAPQQGAAIETAPAPGTEPPRRPETAAESPTLPPPPQTTAAALETAPEAEADMPVPPPGEAVAPDLPPPDLPPPDLPDGPGDEITLMPDGGIVPASPGLPQGIVPGAGAGFAAADGIRVNRLPQVGSPPQGSVMPQKSPGAVSAADPADPARDSAAAAEAPPETLAPETLAPETLAPDSTNPASPESVGPEAVGPEAADGPALEKFAASYSEKPGLPWVSVLLVDVGTGSGGLDHDTIKGLAVPVTVVLDPAAPDAAQSARLYRDSGIEVAMLADPLPKGATPQDLEVALAAWRQAVPQAVALVEPERPVLQTTARLAEQAQKALAAEGMAYVTQSGGMGARGRDGAAQATIWRVLDAKRDKAEVIARAVSRATFEATRDGSVVVMLTAWPESVAGLTAWTAEDGAKFNLAPLSALLGAQKSQK